MKTFRKHLNKKLENQKFKKVYKEEKEILDLSLQILEMRKQNGISQHDLAERAKITQQQLSKIENGINCNIKTFLRVCQALGFRLGLQRSSAVAN